MKRRNFIKLGALGTILYSTNLVSCSSNERKKGRDILVTGATPAGIMAAIAAARLGSSVTLVEYHGHIGGMSTSGLGKSEPRLVAAVVAPAALMIWRREIFWSRIFW